MKTKLVESRISPASVGKRRSTPVSAKSCRRSQKSRSASRKSDGITNIQIVTSGKKPQVLVESTKARLNKAKLKPLISPGYHEEPMFIASSEKSYHLPQYDDWTEQGNSTQVLSEKERAIEDRINRIESFLTHATCEQ